MVFPLSLRSMKICLDFPAAERLDRRDTQRNGSSLPLVDFMVGTVHAESLQIPRCPRLLIDVQLPERIPEYSGSTIERTMASVPAIEDSQSLSASSSSAQTVTP